MHLGLRQLTRFFARYHQDSSLVLAIVTETLGSSYRKPGAMMLISQAGTYAGMISGGCLEGDLVEHTRAVFADGLTRQHEYDLSEEDASEPWSLGLGCGGTVRLLLMRMDRDQGFGFLPQVLTPVESGSRTILALGLNDGVAVKTGDWGSADSAGQSAGPPPLQALASEALALRQAGPKFGAARFNYQSLTTDADVRVLVLGIDPPPRILVCGAGPDAVPVARQIDALGWHGVVVDHRSGMAKAERFPASVAVHCQRPAELATALALVEIDAAIVMSHNIEHDRQYLLQLASQPPPYIGLLGPRARRDLLLEGCALSGLDVHGPAGLDIGAEMPESIALSMIAEIHAVLNKRHDRRP